MKLKEASSDACAGIRATTLAYTLTSASRFEQITLCPWFLDFALSQDPKSMFQREASSNLLDKFSRGLRIFFRGFLAQIDVLADFEVTLLHEISHASAGRYQTYAS
jgi:hypothetical protein